MSHVALQRVMVRMLFDASFAGRVLSDPAALDAEDLSEEERTWLRKPDGRAWRVDAGRPDRSLGVLLQEYPASVALAHQAGGAEPLRAFFASERFHRVVRERGSMAIAFGDHLVDLAGSADAPACVGALARLEQAAARLRRSAGPRPPERDPRGRVFRLSPDKALHATEGGAADLRDEILWCFGRATGPDLVPAVLRPRRRLPVRETDPSREVPLLLELHRDDGPRLKFLVAISEITPELHAILDFAREPREREALEREAARVGAEEEEAREVVAGLVEEGMLVG